MTKDAAYRDATIAIAPLASPLGVTEKKLRELINGQLGFRNFSSYVNAFRLEEVRRRLRDPRAFNRAFKDRHGLTPSAYRAGREAQLASGTV